MGKTARGFVQASLIYLALVAATGLAMLVWPPLRTYGRCAHVPIALVGFVAMMIFGVAYHVLPRFAGRPLYSGSMAGWHLVLQNAGLSLLATFDVIRTFDLIEGRRPPALFTGGLHLGGTLVAASFFLFIGNIWASMRSAVAAPAPAPAPSLPSPPISIDDKVADVIERYPAALAVFVEHGFHALANPLLRKVVGRNVSIAKACSMHGVDVAPFMADLAAATAGDGCCPAHAHAPRPRSRLPLALDTPLGEAIAGRPELKPVFERFFGEGCFSCPAFGEEDVATACGLHGVNPRDFLAACDRMAQPA
jgi:hypothetical protein